MIEPGTVSPPRPVPAAIPRPEYVGRAEPRPYHGPHVQPDDVIERMRVAGRIAAGAVRAVGAAIAPGVTTDALDVVGHTFLCDHGAYPSTLGYRGFPKAVCTSVNEVICHGIPDSRPLADGDIVSIDITAFVDGVHGDTCATFCCGEVDEESRLLVERAEVARDRGVAAVRPGREINVIGRVIQSYAARFGYGIVTDYTGHGVHTTFHSPLIVPHYDEPFYDTVLEPGMTFTIEPMITTRPTENHTWDDEWTVVTDDGVRCAQFEHTLVVTERGAEVLTLP